jgi:hypothetical protein
MALTSRTTGASSTPTPASPSQAGPENRRGARRLRHVHDLWRGCEHRRDAAGTLPPGGPGGRVQAAAGTSRRTRCSATTTWSCPRAASPTSSVTSSTRTSPWTLPPSEPARSSRSPVRGSGLRLADGATSAPASAQEFGQKGTRKGPLSGVPCQLGWSCADAACRVGGVVEGREAIHAYGW